MAQFDLYIDVDRQEAVRSDTDNTIVSLPPFVQGDTIQLRVRLVKNWASEYEFVPNADKTLQIALGTRVGNSSEIYAAQYTWTESTDLADPYWEAEFALSTEEITELLDDQEAADAFFEVKYLVNALPQTILCEPVRIWAAVIKTDSVVPVAEPTPLSVEAANALYVKASGHQGKIRLISPDGTKQLDLYCGDDGALHADPVT